MIVEIEEGERAAEDHGGGEVPQALAVHGRRRHGDAGTGIETHRANAVSDTGEVRGHGKEHGLRGTGRPRGELHDAAAAERVEWRPGRPGRGLGQHEGDEADLLAIGRRLASAGGRTSGVPTGIAGCERQARTSGCRRITAGGSEVSATGSATPAGVLGSATAIGRASSARWSRATARQPRAIASSSPPDHRRPWARSRARTASWTRRESRWRRARLVKTIDDGSASAAERNDELKLRIAFTGPRAGSGTCGGPPEATWASPRSLSERSTSQPPARRADSMKMHRASLTRSSA